MLQQFRRLQNTSSYIFSSFVTGIEELIGLRELDLANNCLCDHRDLEPIKALHRLSKVCYVNKLRGIV